MATEETPERGSTNVRFRLLLSGLSGSRVEVELPCSHTELAGCLTLTRLTPICALCWTEKAREYMTRGSAQETKKKKNALERHFHFSLRLSFALFPFVISVKQCGAFFEFFKCLSDISNSDYSEHSNISNRRSLVFNPV